jgi:hypothetical protein
MKILWYYPGICLEEPTKITKKFNEASRFLSRDFNPIPPEYEAELLLTKLRRSVCTWRSANDTQVFMYFVDI